MIIRINTKYYDSLIEAQGHIFPKKFDYSSVIMYNTEQWLSCQNGCDSYFWINIHAEVLFYKEVVIYKIFDFRGLALDTESENCSQLIMKKILL